RAGRLVVEDRIPRPAVVGGFPDAAVDETRVEDVRLAGHAGDRFGAAAAQRADAAPAHLAEQLLAVGLRVEIADLAGGERDKTGDGEKDQRSRSLHGNVPPRESVNEPADDFIFC